MTIPRISILLPVYNGTRYLSAQIDSLLTQSFGDFELLIYDDGSSDHSVAMLEPYAKRDPRIRLFIGGVNLGQMAALRALLAEARAPLIAFSDQDDIWDSQKLELLVAALGDRALAYGISELIDCDGLSFQHTIFDHVGPGTEGVNDLRLLFGNTVSGHAMLARRAVVDPALAATLRPYDWQIAAIASFSSGIALEPRAKTYHRQHATNQVNHLLALPLPLRDRGERRRQRVRLRRLEQLQILETLTLLSLAPTIPPERRLVFARLRQLLEDEITQGGMKLTSSFASKFMGELRKVGLTAADEKFVAKRVGGLAVRFGNFR